MAAVFDAAPYIQYLPMVDDNADDLEAQLHHELYGEDSLYAVPGAQDNADAHDAEGQDGADERENDEEQYQPDTDVPTADNDETVEHEEDVTGYEERDAALQEDENDADVAEDMPAPPRPEHQEDAAIAAAPTLQVPTTTDVYEIGTPASMAFADEPSEPTPMLILLPGFEEPHHLCANDEPAVLSARKDLYGKTIADLFAALRADPMLHDRFAGDWKEMTLSIPELQLILHEDDGYTGQVRLEDLALVHMAFCAPPVKFILGEQHRFEYRFQAYQAEIQRRMEANEDIISSEPFDPELLPAATNESVSLLTATDVPTKIADAEEEMEEEYEEDDESDRLQDGQEDLQGIIVQAGVDVDEAADEEYYEDEEGNVVDGEPSATGHAEPTTDDGGEEGRDHVHDDTAEMGNDDDADGEDEEEEDFIHVEALNAPSDRELAQAVIEEPEQKETDINGDEVEQVEYEYVDEDGNVLIEGYDSITTHEPTIAEPARDLPDDPAEQPSNETSAQPAEDAPDLGSSDLHEASGSVATQLEEFDLQAALENEYSKAAGTAAPDYVLPDPPEHLEEDIALDHPAMDVAAQYTTSDTFEGPNANDADDIAATQDIVVAVMPTGGASNSGSPTSISGVKRAREDDVEGQIPGEFESAPDSNKRPRVA
ncbi:hypothetical protein CALVIDRAFT_561269 [Calocera viscosa TUFC12733]|uniref:Uncharacterized protein n=1 Tax=Calocera viscosa (strain TUFC12733) TaxID=1330018 RepID=A0A167Q4P7_CALVF|nr:hypothetical protein CALVIDRAFT_561269 [Calocera viscosa TUFC12733]